jgi:hypothetical protein
MEQVSASTTQVLFWTRALSGDGECSPGGITYVPCTGTRAGEASDGIAPVAPNRHQKARETWALSLCHRVSRFARKRSQLGI